LPAADGFMRSSRKPAWNRDSLLSSSASWVGAKPSPGAVLLIGEGALILNPRAQAAGPPRLIHVKRSRLEQADRDQALEAGFNDHLAKPAHLDTVQALLRSLGHEPRSRLP
jgi:hypothetical protein